MSGPTITRYGSRSIELLAVKRTCHAQTVLLVKRWRSAPAPITTARAAPSSPRLVSLPRGYAPNAQSGPIAGGRAVTARPPDSRARAWGFAGAVLALRRPRPRRAGPANGAVGQELARNRTRCAARSPRSQRRLCRPRSGVSNRASRASFSRSAPRGRTFRKRSRSQARAAGQSRRVRQTPVHGHGASPALLTLFAAARARVSPARRRVRRLRALPLREWRWHGTAAERLARLSARRVRRAESFWHAGAKLGACPSNQPPLYANTWPTCSK